ncbi:MAG: GNAT family N-acetyltransferase [Clostridiales bacterium]|jgi:predicted GNAT family acetyltransferase|nr:GNAT family N-acetyltransferase [Clostridiales bacterium]
MKFTRYDNLQAFYSDVHEVLLADEAQNMLILGNLIIGHEGTDTFGWRDPSNWVMAAVAEGGDMRLVALMTPPWNVTLYAVGNAVDTRAVKCLVDGFITGRIPVPGVVTEKSLALAFAEAYCGAKNLTHSIAMSQRIYELREVNPEIPKIGHFRPARQQDLSFLPFWLADFDAAAGGSSDVSADIEGGRYHITGGDLYILEDNGMAVSMAKITRKTPGAACIAYVYTPPYLRGKGYASSVTAQLSRLCLDAGAKSCVLYTDLTNPTSNSIYQKIGYGPICDSLEIKFA